MSIKAFLNGQLIRSDRIERSDMIVIDDRIAMIDGIRNSQHADAVIDLSGKYLAPGFVDIHVHGGGGADFMDLTAEAFKTVCRTHLKHGTTSLTPSSTVSHEKDYATFLNLC